MEESDFPTSPTCTKLYYICEHCGGSLSSTAFWKDPSPLRATTLLLFFKFMLTLRTCFFHPIRWIVVMACHQPGILWPLGRFVLPLSLFPLSCTVWCGRTSPSPAYWKDPRNEMFIFPACILLNPKIVLVNTANQCEISRLFVFNFKYNFIFVFCSKLHVAVC